MQNEHKNIKNIEQFNQFLVEIDILIASGLTNEVYKKYAELIIEIENTEMDNQLKGTIFVSFAYFLFSIYEYEQFLKILRKAQEYEYSKDEIESVLWEAFIEPNLNDFKVTYETNVEYLVVNNYISSETVLRFEDLSFWLIPTGKEKEFYIYNKKKKLIQEKVNLYDFEQIKLEVGHDEFSDFLLIEDNSWRNVLSFLNQVRPREKKMYVVLQDINMFLSCVQGALLNEEIISDVLIFDSYSSMDDYFKQTNAFLPRNIINLKDSSNTAQNYVNTIHNYRLHEKNRKGDNILLSICIPSYNRGNRAYENIAHLLNSKYDEEIEFIVSNNGTQNDTKKYYNKISELPDSRIKYFAFETDQGFANNMCKVCEVASGKYILMLSDEDLVDLVVLDKIMDKLIKSNSTISMVRTSTNTQSSPLVKFAESGEDALLSFMLTSNYISGIIYNNILLKQANGIEYVKENLTNEICLHYPHMFWELLLCQYGKVLGTDFMLISEGTPEKIEGKYVEFVNNDVEIPIYAKFEDRLKQHKDFTIIFNALDICLKEHSLRKKMYLKLCIKTLHLVSLSLNVFYRKLEVDIYKMIDEAYEYCIRKEFTDVFCDDYENDIKIIKEYYHYYKSEL